MNKRVELFNKILNCLKNKVIEFDDYLGYIIINYPLSKKEVSKLISLLVINFEFTYKGIRIDLTQLERAE